MADTIVLGGLRLEVRPLKLGQLRHVLDARLRTWPANRVAG